jgi:hypothetical protein
MWDVGMERGPAELGARRRAPRGRLVIGSRETCFRPHTDSRGIPQKSRISYHRLAADHSTVAIHANSWLPKIAHFSPALPPIRPSPERFHAGLTGSARRPIAFVPATGSADNEAGAPPGHSFAFGTSEGDASGDHERYLRETWSLLIRARSSRWSGAAHRAIALADDLIPDSISNCAFPSLSS